MKMGNCASKNSTSGNFFDWQRTEEARQLEEAKNADKVEKKEVKKTPKVPPIIIPQTNPPPRPPRTDAPSISYDQEAINRLRYQLKNDMNSFLMNNIMLSVQFFDNYDRVLYDLKNNSISASDVELNDNMAQHHKHVFLPDKLQETVDSFVQLRKDMNDNDQNSQSLRRKPVASITRKNMVQIPLQLQRMFVVHDNIDVTEPDDGSNYATVKGVPYYKMLMEESDEIGYVKMKKIEVIGNDQSLPNKRNTASTSALSPRLSDSDSITDDSDDTSKEEHLTESRRFMNSLERIITQPPKSAFKTPPVTKTPQNLNITELNENLRRPSGILKNPMTSSNLGLVQINERNDDDTTTRRPSGILKNSTAAVQRGQLGIQNKPKKPTKTRTTAKKVTIERGYNSSNSPQTESSGYDSDYGYATITYEATPKKLEISQKGRLSDSTSIIPLSCMTAVKVKRTPGSDDDEDYPSRYGDFQRDLFKQIEYLNSNLFMSNFKDLFLMRLYDPLGFTRDNVAQALTQGASIYCSSIKKGQTSRSFEVMPAVNCNWPYSANEWLNRPRRIITNPRTNFSYQWPTLQMVMKSRGLGCFIVPLGFRPTRGTNPEKELQWRLIFPTVERYLETCMAHSQVRCYMFTNALFRFYIENEPSSIGINSTHIKNLMFWQLEDNYAKWPEDRLGEAFIRFLESLYEQIKKTNLPDYFIPQCNLLKGIPSSILLKQQRLLRDILEFPVMHLLACIKNMKYIKTDFYPQLDYKKLYKILTTMDVLQMVNPNLPRDQEIDFNEDDLEEATKGKNLWETVKKEENPEYIWQKEQLRQKNAKKAAETFVMHRTLMKNNFDRKRKIMEFDDNRRRLVLELFIPHFIDMADCSVNFDAGKQAMIYLEQARRLSTLMREESAGQINGSMYLATINEKIDFIKSNIIKTGGPRVPKRNESFSSRQRLGSQSGKINDYGNLDSPTRYFSGTIFADVHRDLEKPEVNKTISIQRFDEESDGENVEESRL